MRDYKLTKQALKSLTNLKKSDPKLATQIASRIADLRQDLIDGEALIGFPKFKKVRVRHFRIIYIIVDEILQITIIEKRATVYQTFAHLMKNSHLLN